MEYKTIPLGKKIIVECLPDGGILTNEQAALDLVGICGYEQTDCILLYSSNLSEDFYNLKSGLAGQVMLKWTNYRIKAAAVIPPEKIGSGRFYEMVIETNRRNDFRVFSDRESAIEWLERLQ